MKSTLVGVLKMVVVLPAWLVSEMEAICVVYWTS
jgi:hypothetical protein